MQTLRKLVPRANVASGGNKKILWHNLSAFTVTPEAQESWKKIRADESTVTGAIKLSQMTEYEPINWAEWEGKISHKNIVASLKTYYESEVGKYNSVLTNEQEAERVSKLDDVKTLVKREKYSSAATMFNDSVNSCQKSVDALQGILENGAKALWISAKNPPVQKVDTNEWLDSDLHFQAIVEKHHLNSAYEGSHDIADAEAAKATKANYHMRLAKFNDRSDTPMLYSKMEHYPSWEYYDIHRKSFYEHLLYYLVRSGNSYRFFPELPPMKWITHIEDLRYKYVSVCYRRKLLLRLMNLEMSRSMDLEPTAEEDGETYYAALLADQNNAVETYMADLMEHYRFLTNPYIPITSSASLETCIFNDTGVGKVYRVEECPTLYYLPMDSTTNKSHSIETPKGIFYRLNDYFNMHGLKFTCGYGSLFDIFSEILQLRGKYWFNLEGETPASAFLRRLELNDATSVRKNDNPYLQVFSQYFDELQDKLDSKAEITVDKAFKILNDQVE